MKRILILLLFSLVLLTAPFSLPAYDYSPSNWKVIPECIWAPATGGGTWVTEIELISMSATATVNVDFYYGGGLKRGPITLVAGLPKYRSVKFNNILHTLDDLDSGAFTYYGKVGAVWFHTWDPAAAPAAPTVAPDIQVTAKTINGNFGKTFPGLTPIAANTAAEGRYMRITNLVNSATYRTFVGFFNTSGSATYTATFAIISAGNGAVGASFSKTFVPYDYQAFNPFVAAGVGSGSYSNCWLAVYPSAGGGDARGLMCYGSIANNISNDSSALIAYPWSL